MTAFTPRPGQALPVGAPVRVLKQPPEPHCRTPFYLRGVAGEITDVMGCYRDPSSLAYHKPGLPMRVLYRLMSGPTIRVARKILSLLIFTIIGSNRCPEKKYEFNSQPST